MADSGHEDEQPEVAHTVSMNVVCRFMPQMYKINL